jgi:hypothetical protein
MNDKKDTPVLPSQDSQDAQAWLDWAWCFA